jgi:hypothetical protein
MTLAVEKLMRPLFWFLALSAVTVPAFADPVESPPPVGAPLPSPEVGEARERFREATAAAEAGRWPQALELYRAAYALYPHATTAYNIGYCYGQLAEPARALFYTTHALDADAFEADRRLAPDRQAEAQASQALLLGRVASVSVNVHSAAPFTLSVDGVLLVPSGMAEGSFVPSPHEAPLASSPVHTRIVKLYLDPGRHELVLVSDGRTHARSLDVQAGQAASLDWSLGPSVTRAPSPAAAAAPGPRAPASVAPAPPAPAAAAAEVEASPYRKLAIGSFVVGGAGFGLALVSSFVVLAADSHLEDECRDDGVCPEAESDVVNRYKWGARLTNVGLWTGVIGSAAGVGFLVLDGADQEPDMSIVVQPASVELQGSF